MASSPPGNSTHGTPGVAAAKESDRAIARYLLGFEPTREVGGIMLPAEAEGRFFYNAEMTGFNFTTHQGRLGAFLGELLRLAEEPQPAGMAVQSEQIPELLPGFVEANPMPLVPGVVPRNPFGPVYFAVKRRDDEIW